MAFPKSFILRILDALLLSAVFLVQSVILSQYTVYPQADSQIPNNYVNPALQKLLWLTGDLISISALLLASLFGLERALQNQSSDGNTKSPKTAIEEATDEEKEEQTSNSRSFFIIRFFSSKKIPLCYTSWFIYSTLLIIKVTVIFTSSSLHKSIWREDEGHGHEDAPVFGYQLLQLGIALSSIVFSLLVEAHHNSGGRDPHRNAFLSSLSYEVALEILDTAALLSYLIPSFEHVRHHESLEEYSCPATNLSAVIILLSACNLILPTILLYKLTTTKFGEVYHVKLELLYKSLHFILVNLPFFTVRIYLWNVDDREEVIFALKNLYGILAFFRVVYSDLRLLKQEKHMNRRRAVDAQRIGVTPKGIENAVEMKSLMKNTSKQ